MTKSFKSIIVLTVACLIMAFALGAVNLLTEDTIAQNETERANLAKRQVRPGAEEFKAVNIEKYEFPETVEEFYTDDIGGFVAVLLTSGYQSGLKIMCGIDSEEKVTGAVCLASNETLGKEKAYGSNLLGKNLTDIDTVDTVGGATMTTAAYRGAVKDALGAVSIYLGGSYDARSEEEKLLDAALPSADGRFTEWFVIEKIEGVERVFTADNGSGYVLYSDGKYVGADNSGNALSDTDIDVATAVSTVKGASLTEINIPEGAGVAPSVVGAYRSGSGNLVLDLEGSGYGKSGGKHASGKPISIKLCIDKLGEIVSVKTISQYETQGIGSECDKYSFYSQLFGKTKENYREIDAISSATVTTDGYLDAVGDGFAAHEIMKGESAL